MRAHQLSPCEKCGAAGIGHDAPACEECERVARWEALALTSIGELMADWLSRTPCPGPSSLADELAMLARILRTAGGERRASERRAALRIVP